MAVRYNSADQASSSKISANIIPGEDGLYKDGNCAAPQSTAYSFRREHTVTLFHDKAARRLAIGLAALAGYIDALGFLSLGGVFVSFMSGNSTRFAVDVSNRDISVTAALLPLGMIVLFVIGVILGRTIRHYSQRKPSTAILFFMSLTLAAAGLIHETSAHMLGALLLAVAMGAANNIFFREGEVSVGVTYMTGTLVKFGQRLAGRLLGEKDHNWQPYLLLWIGLVCGAVLGSAGYVHYGFKSLWLAVIVCCGLTVICARIERHS